MTLSDLQKQTPAAVQDAVFHQLGRYVYMLVDPENGIPFYVGKGQNRRLTSHHFEAMMPANITVAEQLEDETDPLPETKSDERIDRRQELNRKLAKIQEISKRPGNPRPDVWIVRHKLSKGEYTAVEAATIDFLQSFPIEVAAKGKRRLPLEEGRQELTNLRREKSAFHGMVLLDTLIQEYSVEDLPSDTPPLMTIALGGWKDTPEGEPVPWGTRLGHGYKSEWLQTESRLRHLDDIAASAAAWFYFAGHAFDGKREYAVAVHRGITRALMWVEPGSVVNSHYDPTNSGTVRRGFKYRVVRPGEEVRPGESELYEKVIGTHGKRINRRNVQNSIYYWPRNK